MLSGSRFPGSSSEPVRGKTGMTCGSGLVSDIIYKTGCAEGPFPGTLLPRPRLEHGEEGLLRDLDRAHHLHPLLAFLLLLEQLALARDVAAVALGGDVLAVGVDGRAGDDVAADRSLDGDLEVLPWDRVG